MGNSRHRRHLRVLKSLVKSGWKVEACHHGPFGFGGNVSELGRQVFRPFNKPYRFRRDVYYTPPDPMGGGKATFFLVRTVHTPAPPLPCLTVRVNGWKDLSAFAVQERRAREAEAKAKAEAKEGEA